MDHRLSKIVVLSCLIACFMSCSYVRVYTDHGFMGPDTFVATDGNVGVRYWNGRCCCVAKKVLESLAYRANSGDLDWNRMSDEKFRDFELDLQCKIERAVEYGYWESLRDDLIIDYTRH